MHAVNVLTEKMLVTVTTLQYEGVLMGPHSSLTTLIGQVVSFGLRPHGVILSSHTMHAVDVPTDTMPVTVGLYNTKAS